MTYTWINPDEPEQQMKIQWAAQGFDDFEKGIGKALTYSQKYFMLTFFNISSDKDDPDSAANKQRLDLAALEARIGKPPVTPTAAVRNLNDFHTEVINALTLTENITDLEEEKNAAKKRYPELFENKKFAESIKQTYINHAKMIKSIIAEIKVLDDREAAVLAATSI